MTDAARVHSDDAQISELRLRLSSIPCAPDQTSPVLTLPSLQTADVLSQIDELSDSVTGALVFSNVDEDYGAVLIEKGRVCWAMARGLNTRLTDILQHRFSSTLNRGQIESLVQECRKSRRPFGELLVERGFVTPLGLRSALRQQTIEAIAAIAAVGTRSRLLPHKNETYDPQYSFSTAELLGALGSMRKGNLAALARRALQPILQEKVTCLAYARDGGGQPLLLGLHEEEHLTISQLHQLARLAQSQLDVGEAMSSGLRVFVGTNHHRCSIVAWQEDPLMFVALCPEACSMARIVTKVSRK